MQIELEKRVAIAKKISVASVAGMSSSDEEYIDEDTRSVATSEGDSSEGDSSDEVSIG